MVNYVSITGYLINSTRKEIVKYSFRHPSIYNSKFDQLIGTPKSILEGLVNGTKAYMSASWDRNEYIDVYKHDNYERNIKFDVQSYLDKGYKMK